MGLFLVTLYVLRDVNHAAFTASLTNCAALEVIWTLVPCVFILLGVTQSLGALYALDSSLASGLTYHVVGSQWYWTVSDGNVYHDCLLVHSSDLSYGSPRLALSSECLYLCSSSVSLTISSADVLHCLSVPTLGLKCDAIPGRLNSLTASGLVSGTYSGYCNELCGSGHGFMPLTIVVSASLA